MNRKLVLCLLPVFILACFAPVPVTEAASTATARSESAGSLIGISEPAALIAETCTLVAATDTNVRSCASVSCDTTGDWIRKGEIISAVCNQLWAYVPRRGWVCVPALTGTGGCE